MATLILDGTLIELTSFAASYWLIVATPGSNFLLVSSASMNSDRRQALSAALGVGVGACILCCSVAFGAERLYDIGNVRHIVSILFTGQLLWLAAKSLQRGYADELPWRRPADRPAGYFLAAFFTGLLNPTTALFFALPRRMFQLSPLMVLVGAAIVLSVATAWFSLIATVASTARVRTMPLATYRIVNRLFATAFFAFALMTAYAGMRS